MRASIFIAAVSMSAIAMAQTPASHPQQAPTPALLVFPVAGAPLTAEIVEERNTIAPDGKSQTITLTSRIFRDEQGRMRIERQPADPMPMIQIINGVDGFMAILIPLQNLAARLEMPKDASVAISRFSPGALGTVSGSKTRKFEVLGKQTIDGIEYEGHRTTAIADKDPSLVGIDEEWSSRDLGLIGIQKSSGPEGQSTAKLHILDRNPPDPELFKIPTNYYIQELKDDAPAR